MRYPWRIRVRNLHGGKGSKPLVHKGLVHVWGPRTKPLVLFQGADRTCSARLHIASLSKQPDPMPGFCSRETQPVEEAKGQVEGFMKATGG